LNVYNKIASVFEGAYRLDFPDYPEIVFREAILNSVTHRNYNIGGSILVSMFSDRTEILSLGGLLPGLTQELVRTGVSVLRNDKLAALFFRLNLIDSYGTGIPRIFETYATFNVTPSIPIVDSGFLISLPNLSWVNAATMTTTRSNSEQRILSHFRNVEFTKQNVSDLLGISDSGAYKLLQRMVGDGCLRSRKNDRELRYRILY
jgi:ATP-dependent DNA helicase RecG